MDETQVELRKAGRWRRWIDITQSASIIALAVSLVSFYRSYFYVNQELAVTVTEVSYGTNRGELYMTVAFSNGGNRDAAVLRARAERPRPRSAPDSVPRLREAGLGPPLAAGLPRP